MVCYLVQFYQILISRIILERRVPPELLRAIEDVPSLTHDNVIERRMTASEARETNSYDHFLTEWLYGGRRSRMGWW